LAVRPRYYDPLARWPNEGRWRGEDRRFNARDSVNLQGTDNLGLLGERECPV